MGQALYRKYRSKSLDEIVGQKHITDTLKRAIAADRIAHAYLFTGPRGVGKTSIARILAHEVNGLPYSTEDSHLDIIEIDAASNGGVEEVRDLRDRVHIAPSSGKYKVYIIDEVHMMTTAAFNALLKTLEEPPAHVIFILATTEAHKLPATIVSRTQQFTFRPVPTDTIAKHLRYIAEKEGMEISDEALALIAEHSEGTFRDSISMLDQASSSSKRVERIDVEQLLGIPAANTADQLIQLLAAQDTSGIITKLETLRASGYQAAAIAKQLSTRLRMQFLQDSTALSKEDILALLAKLIEVPASHRPEQLLELTLLEAALDKTAADVAPPTATVRQPSPQVLPQTIQQPINATPKTTPVPVVTSMATPVVAPAPMPSEEASVEMPLGTATVDMTQWQAVLTALGKQYNTLYGIIRMARPEFSPGHIKLTFGFAFHQKRANDAKNKQIILALLENTTGQRFSLECLFDKSVTPIGPTPAAATGPISSASATTTIAAPPALDAINAVFGGGEVLPS
jgi:DNA polymerase-3 subunit gamma/tau